MQQPAAGAAGEPRRGDRRRRQPAGSSPGTLVADPHAVPTVLRAIAWDQSQLVDETGVDLQRLRSLRQRHTTLWIDVTGFADTGLLQELGQQFGLHRLALEDAVSTHQRAKVEDYPAHLFVVLRMLDAGDARRTEQFALCLGDGFLVTLQERAGDCFGQVRQRLQDTAGRLRAGGVDYLAYALLDAVVDAYFPALEAIGDRLEAIEERIVAGANKDVVAALHTVRADLLVARRALWPLRDVTAALARGEVQRFLPETRIYLRDVQDHAVQLIDLLENYRELGASLMELHLATTSHRLNEVMKVLTVIATIFIPLTFVVGIYGMNFDWMPELRLWYGYPVVMAGMLAIAVGMLVWFRRRCWI